MTSFQSFVSIPSSLILLACFALAGCSSVADEAEQEDSLGTSAEALSPKCAPVVDPLIAAPAGNKLSFSLDAVGVQIYACQATATGFGWVFQAPEADLSDKHGRVVVKHFAGPTWQFKDGSKVVAARVNGVTPDPASIPWLLLQATTHEGEGRMSNITFIQRINTVGGIAPAAASCTATNVGEVARVGYAATYTFFEAGTPPCHCN